MSTRNSTTAPTFAPLARADILDALCLAVDYAKGSTAPDAWQRAIDSAWGWLLAEDVYQYDQAARVLRVESATRPGTIYQANGACSCEAATLGAGVCWHRAASRLIARALELHDLAGELLAEAKADDDRGYDYAIAVKAASWRIPELVNFGQQWDAQACPIVTARAA
jgi:hypothetical protein